MSIEKIRQIIAEQMSQATGDAPKTKPVAKGEIHSIDPNKHATPGARRIFFHRGGKLIGVWKRDLFGGWQCIAPEHV